MGQGFYTALVFGGIRGNDGIDGDAWYEWVHQAAEKHGIGGRTRYEARQDWFGFFIAENGAGISNDGDGCELFSYEVFDAARLAHQVLERWPAQLQKCDDAYETLTKIAKANGVNLPLGRILLVNDYD